MFQNWIHISFFVEEIEMNFEYVAKLIATVVKIANVIFYF